MRTLVPIAVLVLLIWSLAFAGCTSPSTAPANIPTATAPTAPSPDQAAPAAHTPAPTLVPSATTQPKADNTGKVVTVFAAASLTDSFKQLGDGFATLSGGAKAEFSFAGSNTLRAQIQQGARPDVFASANTTEMDTLVKDGLIAGDPQIFAKNRLVIIVPKANPAKIEKPQDLAKSGVKLVVAGANVPVGKYTLQILDKMTADSAYGADFKDKVTSNFISQETDVKQVVAKIQLGEGDAGVVYLTDVTAKAAADIAMIDIPDPFNVVAQYPIATVKDGPQSALGQAFVDYVLSADGQQILKQHNFVPAR